MEEEQYFNGGNFDSEAVFIEDGIILYRKEVFFFKVLLSAILVLSVAILYKNAPSSFNGAKAVTEKVMKEEFQFATVAKWYEKQFGKPLVFYSPNEKKKEVFSKRLCNSCWKGNARVSKMVRCVQTATNAKVESVNEGLVVLQARKRTWKYSSNSTCRWYRVMVCKLKRYVSEII